MLSEGDHRLSHVAPWIAAHQQTLSRCVNPQVWPRDGADDRLARGLDDLGVVDKWVACACARNQTRMRVDDLHPKTARVDPTTVSASVTPDGMFQLGHSKDDRPDLPQLTIALSTLDPLGLPMTIAAVAGNTADDPLSLPEIATVRRSVGQTGMTDIGDGTIAALATRADLVAHDDVSRGPLSATQVSAEERERRLEPVWRGQQPREAVRLTDESDPDDEDEPDAVGFAYPSAQGGQDQSGQPRRWQERRVVVRSLAHARLQEARLRTRATRATDAIKALNERQQGKTRLADEAEARQAAEARVATHPVAEVVRIAGRTTGHEATQRRYGQRPAQTIRTTRVRVEAGMDHVALEQAVRRLGWRVYATNHDRETMRLTHVVVASRSASLVEQGMRRLQGRALSLTPRSWRDAPRIVGVIFLLSIALRVLVLRQFVARENLQKEGATLTGISPGQPGRHTTLPTTEMRLCAFRGIT
jgi:transposase